MSRSTKWKLGAAVLVLGVAGAALYLMRGGDGPEPPEAGEKLVWHYAVWGPPRAFTAGPEKAKELWERAGQGRFEFNIAYASALSPEKEHLDAIKIGLIEAAHVCVGYAPAKTPLTQVLELPFLLTGNERINVRVVNAVMRHPLIEEELRTRWNARYLFPIVTAPGEFMGSRRVAGADDLRGLRIRVPGALSTVLEKFGAVPVGTTAPEVYTAVERGTVDLAVFPWTDSFGVYRLHEVSKFATTGAAMRGTACFSVVSVDAWNRLPQDLKDMYPHVQAAAEKAYFDAYEAADRRWLPVFGERLEIVSFPPEEREKLVTAARPIWEQWAAEKDREGLPGTEMLRFVQEHVARFSQSN
jgi:TRAP-type C4-dicarboxylate transport system substrate-binding protein